MRLLHSLALMGISVVMFPGLSLAGYPGANGKILYVDRSGDLGAHLIVVNNDGTNKDVLTAGLELEITRASWSPDGSRIAFTGHPRNSPVSEGRLYLIDPTGASIEEINIAPARNADLPTWSPDGTRIAFAGIDDSTGGSHNAIFAINLDGTGLVRLSPPPEEYFYFSLAWSPLGNELLFAGLLNPPCPLPPCSVPDSDAEVYVLSLGSGITTRLTTNAVLEQIASWSPDGGRIVFDQIPTTDPSCKLIVKDLATGQETDITRNKPPKRCYQMPAWSPDGSSIAFTTSTTMNDTSVKIFVTDATGKGNKQITDGPRDFWPDWQPLHP